MDNKRAGTHRLLEYLGQVPDHRDRHGRRHPLPAVLALTVAAMAAGARSLLAVHEWGRALQPEQARSLGFTREKTPSVSTLHEVFKRLDVAAFEQVLSQWAQEQCQGELVIAIDGKGLRGIHGEELPGVRLVAAYNERAGLVLAQVGGQGGTPRS
jgi:predicted glycoside hydrolase/deacetylase ChbG (UPF0249 family)